MNTSVVLMCGFVIIVAKSALHLGTKDKETVGNYSGDDPLISQFLEYAARGRCVRECKARNLPPKLRNPDPNVIQEFRKRFPYSYLHFAYYQVSMVIHQLWTLL